MRGKPRGTPNIHLSRRNIPAHAGKTIINVACDNPDEEHPRACGENTGLLNTVKLVLGTSPRMRGKRNKDLEAQNIERNIPAHAGKTILLMVGFMIGCGTSPRMRGKRANSTYDQLKPRNIPAHAGKTTADFHARNALAEHPRACGENRTKPTGKSLLPGTSPRMRGKRHSRGACVRRSGNIPAHAGKTDSSGCGLA